MKIPKQFQMLEGGVLANCRAMGKYLGDAVKALAARFPQIGWKTAIDTAVAAVIDPAHWAAAVVPWTPSV